MTPFSETIFSSAFGELPPALSLFMDGRMVKSNAAFQYAAREGVTLEEAQRILCGKVERTEWAQGWRPSGDGMLVTAIREDWIRKKAAEGPFPDASVRLIRHDAPFFPERSILLRIAASQKACGTEERIRDESASLFLEVLFDERTKEVTRLIRQAGDVLDILQEAGDGPDPALLAAAGILQMRLERIRTEEKEK